MISRTNEIGYPEILFWKKKAPQITFINRKDFRESKLLKILGLSKSSLAKSFGVTDREEILRRQRTLKLFVQNPSLIKLFTRSRLCFPLPTEGQAFLNYFRPDRKHNPFWSLMTTFIRKVSRCKGIPCIPSEIASLVSFLKRTGLKLEQEETAMARKIGERLQKATYFEGVACFKIGDHGHRFSEKGSSIYGFKKYSYSLSRILPEIQAPGWAENVVLEKAIELTQAIISWVNGRIFYRPLKIRHIPMVTIREIGSFLDAKFMDSLKEFCDRDHDLVLKILFRFSVDGLEIQLIGIEREESRKKKEEEEYKMKQSFSGYTWRDHLRIRKINKKVLKEIRETEEQFFLNRITAAIEKVIPDISKGFVRIESPNTDLSYKWDAVSIMYRKEFKDVYRRVSKYHNYLYDHFCILREIAEVAKALKSCSKKWRKPLCFPEILDDDKHMVSFESLEPIHLINQKIDSKKLIRARDLVSINSLPSLNGQMIGLTGQNAGGKSTTQEAIVNAIFMAQSGLPVLGTNFTLNVKTRIGMSFLERGGGSTLQLLLQKSKEILKSLDGTGQNGTLLAVDEVGTGTQEVDGLAFGELFLAKLAKSGCSVIFSTQITDLARYAERNLSAECFTFDLSHRVSPGIGRGGIENLIDQMKMKKLLQ